MKAFSYSIPNLREALRDVDAAQQFLDDLFASIKGRISKSGFIEVFRDQAEKLGVGHWNDWDDDTLKRYILNPDADHVKRIEEAIAACQGHCPCKAEWTPETICPCSDFRMGNGCICKKYVTRENL